jgi:hypothetical protein
MNKTNVIGIGCVLFEYHRIYEGHPPHGLSETRRVNEVFIIITLIRHWSDPSVTAAFIISRMEMLIPADNHDE